MKSEGKPGKKTPPIKAKKHHGKAESKASPKQAGKKTNLERWDANVDKSKAFRDKFGHCKIPTSFKEDKSLGIWVQETRRNFKLAKQGKSPRCRLTEAQIEELDAIGFHWGWTPDPTQSAESDASWEANFSQLKEYRESNGNFDVPIDGDLAKLGTWVRAQRHQKYFYDSKKKTFITKDRIAKLSDIGFNWKGDRKV